MQSVNVHGLIRTNDWDLIASERSDFLLSKSQMFEQHTLANCTQRISTAPNSGYRQLLYLYCYTLA